MAIADFTGTEADELRKAMSFKKSDDRMILVSRKLDSRMKAKGVSIEAAPESHRVHLLLRSLRLPGKPRHLLRPHRLRLLLAESPPSRRVLLRPHQQPAHGILLRQHPPRGRQTPRPPHPPRLRSTLHGRYHRHRRPHHPPRPPPHQGSPHRHHRTHHRKTFGKPVHLPARFPPTSLAQQKGTPPPRRRPEHSTTSRKSPTVATPSGRPNSSRRTISSPTSDPPGTSSPG